MATLDALPDTPPVAEAPSDQANDTPIPPPIALDVPPPAPPAPQTPPSAPAVISAHFEPAPADLIAEIKVFEQDSCARYKFNNRWDVVLSILGILLSIAVVAAGFIPRTPWLTSILGAIVAAVVTAQKAFPFGQRAAFYRIIIGQSRNLRTRSEQKVIDKVTVVNSLSSLRMDFAQQLPRGSSVQASDQTVPAPPKPTGGDPASTTSASPGAGAAGS